jgi:CRISPR-associated exonuclease Cas4
VTMQGRIAHDRVDHGPTDYRRGLVVHHSVSVASERLRVFGIADTVEEDSAGKLRPVEHKRGRGAGDLLPSTIHVVAQALCLEEMTGRSVESAAIYIAIERRRIEIDVAEHRARVESVVANAYKALIAGGSCVYSPSPRLCRSCSIRESCQPEQRWES